jgi:outer membrane protein assembly factor BamC
VRLERGVKPGTTEIYLTHMGMEQVVDRRALGSALGSSTSPSPSYWQVRKPDPELEAEILQRLVVHIGGDPATAKTIAKTTAEQPQASESTSSTTRLVRNGKGAQVLTLQDSLDRAWRRVGLSLDRGGFTVEDRDRSRGVYYVRYNDPDKPKKSSFFGSPKPTEPDQYQIRLESADKGTQVEVLNKDGAVDTTKASERILSLLYEQLK